MIIRKYGIELIRLKEEDIELVREKRNSPEIQRKMFYQRDISKEEQLTWFYSINNEKNYYFIIKVHQKKVGLIHGKIHSYDERIAEGGMFIWDEESLGSHIPVIASVCMADLTFMVMKMEKTIAEVRKDNPKALNYNLELGYQVVGEDNDSKKVMMELTREDYFLSSEKLREMVKRISKDETNLSWDDIEVDEDYYQELYYNLPEYLKSEVNKKLSNV